MLLNQEVPGGKTHSHTCMHVATRGYHIKRVCISKRLLHVVGYYPTETQGSPTKSINTTQWEALTDDTPNKHCYAMKKESPKVQLILLVSRASNRTL